ncbi:MAG: histidine phosphatase family protein [Deltaproteobacteria bacterium]|nr:histidine phosphatase family protein [Deltaproteobacteria bacterium]
MTAREGRTGGTEGARLFLVRHGRSEGNRPEGTLLGRGDPPLTDAGMEEADAAASLLARRLRPGARLYASPLARARDSARRLGDRLGLPVRLAAALVELDMGRLEGRLWSDVPAERARWDADPGRYRFPGGEGLDDVARRAEAWFGENVAGQPGDTVVVAHLFVILALTARILRLPLDEILRLHLEHGGVVELRLSPAGGRLHGLYPGRLA